MRYFETKESWRVLRTLSDLGFLALTLALVLSFVQDFGVDFDDPVERTRFLARRYWYWRIELAAAATAIILRIAYWIIEYVHDRRQIKAAR